MESLYNIRIAEFFPLMKLWNASMPEPDHNWNDATKTVSLTNKSRYIIGPLTHWEMLQIHEHFLWNCSLVNATYIRW